MELHNLSHNRPFLPHNETDKGRIISFFFSHPIRSLVKCNNCNKSMLVKNCYVDMTVNFTIEKEGKEYSVTAFPKVVSLFLEKDIFEYKNDTDTLIEELLLLEDIDFHLSQNGKLITKLQNHQMENPDQMKTMALTTMPINNVLLLNTLKLYENNF